MSDSNDANAPNAAATYTLWQLMLYFLRLGTLGFGGPVALVGFMRRDLVDERQWITDADYKEGLALAQIAPGPLAAQLAIYLGFVHHRILGATVAGLAFVAPSFLMVVGLGMAYVSYGGLSWMQAVFYGGIVTEHHWLNDRQFVDAVAVAMITPGPVVITTGFIGYLIAGFQGASIAAAATFLPCYLITIIAAPHFKKWGKNPSVIAFVDGITAAAIGAIAGSVVVIAQRSITDIPTAVLALGTTALLWKFKVPEPLVVLGAALIGLALYPLTH